MTPRGVEHNHKVVRKPKDPKPPPDAPVDGLRRAPIVILDWGEYFREFCRAHMVKGGGYVMDGERLLFGDGWSCAVDHRGPYWPPPTDLLALNALLVRYWRRRLQIVRAEVKRAADTLEGLDELRRNYPLPLKAKRVLITDEGMPTVDAADPHGDVDWYALSERLRWLQGDALDCEVELLNLGERP